ncbi:MAG: polysaccharide deacetylase family protein [Rhodothermales bacterium]
MKKLHTCTSPAIFAAAITFVLLCPFLPVGNSVYAQSVHTDVYLDRTTATTFTKLDQLRTGDKAQIGLFFSENTIRFNSALEPAVNNAIRLWEHFLVGMDLPYHVMGDTSLTSGIGEQIKLLIMPNAEVLSERQREVVRAYMQRGGGLIASGRVGFLDDRGVLQNDRFFKEIFGAEPSIELPDSLNGLLQTIEGGHPPTNGIAPGFQLNVSRPALGTAVLPLDSQPMGHLVAYERMDIRLIEQALNVSTLLLRGEYGGGRFVWMGFNPQDVSLDEQQQAVYQGLVLNSMAHVTRVPALSVRRWPHGFTSASSFAVLPSLGYQPYAYRLGMDLVLNAMDRAKVKATYFIVTSRVDDHPDIIDRIVTQGELALTSDTDAMLAKQPMDLQYNRVRLAKEKLGRLTKHVHGFYPPGGFYDPNTLRVMVDLELDYMLSDARTLNVPTFLRWEDELDYRDVLLSSEIDSSNVSTELAMAGEDAGVDRSMKQKEVITLYPSLFSYALDDRSGVSGPTSVRERWSAAMEANFLARHNAEGLFLFAFEPETMGLTQQRSQVLEEFGRYVRTQNTWIATLGDMSDWWSARNSVAVEIESVNPDGYTLMVQNNSGDVIRGLSLDFALDVGAHRLLDLEAGRLEVWSKRDLEKMLLVIELLPPGSHQIHLKDPSITTADASDNATN